MIKVIGNRHIRQTECKCGAILEYDTRTDLEITRAQSGYFGKLERMEYKFLTCPECHNKILISSNIVPIV